MTELAPIYQGWNVWAVYQVHDLDFSVLMVGVSRDKQLQIWVEDSVRVNAPGATVADPIDFKGSQVQILRDVPTGLSYAVTKEQVSGPAMLLDGPAELRYVRFYNRGAAAVMPWPHNDNYLLNAVYKPDSQNPLTKGPGPIVVTDNLGKPIGDLIQQATPWFAAGLAAYVLYLATRD